MRHINKFFASFIGALVLAIALVGSATLSAEAKFITDQVYENSSTGYKAIIQDDAFLIDDEDERDLLEEMVSVTNYGNLLIYTTLDSGGTDSKTEATAEKLGIQYFDDESQTVMIIAMDTRYIYIHSYGHNYTVITKSKAESITDNIYTYASDGDYYKTCSRAVEYMGRLLSGERISEPMRYICIALISILAGLLICFGIVNASAALKMPSNAEILGPAGIKYIGTPAEVEHTGQTKTYSPVSSSSGGGGSHGGGHGGGGHHGGGGGHHF